MGRKGLLLFRLPTVQLFALLFQLPPRLTRLVPDAPPYKVHTVFYSKIFEPLKRLTQCSFIFKNTLHHKTHFAYSVSLLRAAYAAPSAAQPLRQNV